MRSAAFARGGIAHEIHIRKRVAAGRLQATAVKSADIALIGAPRLRDCVIAPEAAAAVAGKVADGGIAHEVGIEQLQRHRHHSGAAAAHARDIGDELGVADDGGGCLQQNAAAIAAGRIGKHPGVDDAQPTIDCTNRATIVGVAVAERQPRQSRKTAGRVEDATNVISAHGDHTATENLNVAGQA